MSQQELAAMLVSDAFQAGFIYGAALAVACLIGFYLTVSLYRAARWLLRRARNVKS